MRRIRLHSCASSLFLVLRGTRYGWEKLKAIEEEDIQARIFNFIKCSAGILSCLDGFMNIALEQTEEYSNGQLKNKYGDAFIRGNNGEFFFAKDIKDWNFAYKILIWLCFLVRYLWEINGVSCIFYFSFFFCFFSSCLFHMPWIFTYFHPLIVPAFSSLHVKYISNGVLVFRH